jgi:hypothetical protein
MKGFDEDKVSHLMLNDENLVVFAVLLSGVMVGVVVSAPNGWGEFD